MTSDRERRATAAGGLSRRGFLGGAVAGAAVAGVGARAAIDGTAVTHWDLTTDVVVMGSGAAGMCAALEATGQGASVLVLESLPRFGGSSAMSGGVVYAGGGTVLQRALGVSATVEAMYDFIANTGALNPQRDKVQRYCEESVAHFDWLVDQGVPYSEGFTAAKGLPMGDESLYVSGNELAWPAREQATPAARGHVPGVAGMTGGRTLMAALLGRAGAASIEMQSRSAVTELVTASDGRVIGVRADMAGETKHIRAKRGVVLAAGGFIHNRDMLARYAPELAQCSVPWGNAGDLGAGILLGLAAGGDVLRMDHGFAIAPIYPPENVLSGIVVNHQAQRFVAEDSYHGVLGHHIAYQQQGKAWLITDADSSYALAQDNFPEVASANSIGALATAVGFPAGALQHTLAYYNRFAARGRDPQFQKSPVYLRPLQGPPYKAWALSVDEAFFPAHTFGGLHTDINGRVLTPYGEPVPGLFAAGRTTAGLPLAPYIASGLSLGDCTYFGRQAGLAAAGDLA